MELHFFAFFMVVSFTFLATAAISLGINLFRTIKIDVNSKTIEIRYLGLLETRFRKSEIRGYKSSSLLTRYGVRYDTLIEAVDGRQWGFNSFEIKDYETARAITSVTFQLNENINGNAWAPLKYPFIAIVTTMGLLLVSVLILG